MMATRTLTAMFSTRAEAERAGQALVSELRLDRAMIRTSPDSDLAATGVAATDPYEDKGFFASLKDLFLPEEDQHVYAEGVRRGSVLLTAQVDENQVDRASDILEREGAADLDAQEAEWRQSGWTGYDASRAAAATGSATTARGAGTAAGATVRAGQDETLKVVEERLKVGKREVDRGSVRVRSYVVETPVEEKVTLRDETVHIERRPVDRVATDADKAAFRDMTIEARETDEEAVITKEARVVEEIGLRKEATDHVETVSDTVRKTKVEVEDTTGTRGDVRTTGAGAAAIDSRRSTGLGTDAPDGTPGNPKGTMASRAVDKALDTNISGTNPGADAPDGTPGNPKGTMASRGVDKTLGTNISGTNPGRK